MKTIKNKAKLDFYSLEQILKCNADYNIIYGERSNGKSYAVKLHCIKQALEQDEEFVLIRRYDTEIKRARLEAYFADMKIDEISGGTYNEIYIWNSQIYVAKNEEGKRKNQKKIGYAKALNVVQSESGTQYPNVNNIILEEFIALDGQYITSELFRFNHILSTVARRRNVKVFMLANSISRISPYWREYGIDEIIKAQEMGTICIIERTTESGEMQRVAVEYCTNTRGRSRMFSGAREDMINKGKWLALEQPKLPLPRDEFEKLYCFVLEYKNNKFLVEYLQKDNDYCLFVTPKTSEIKKDTRIISDRSYLTPLATLGLVPLNNAERQLFNLLQIGKVFYADNQTGTEFTECLKNLKRLYY